MTLLRATCFNIAKMITWLKGIPALILKLKKTTNNTSLTIGRRFTSNDPLPKGKSLGSSP